MRPRPTSVYDNAFLGENLSVEQLNREVEEAEEKKITDPAFWRPYEQVCRLALDHQQLDTLLA